MAIIIRSLVESDYPQWFIIWEKYLDKHSSTGDHAFTLPEKVSKTTFSRLVDPKEPMSGFVAEDDETHEVVGMANFTIHIHTLSITPYVFINDLYVNESYRNQGIARKLLQRVYQYADDNNYSNVHLNTLFNNHRSQLLYTKAMQRSGFVSYSRSTQIDTE